MNRPDPVEELRAQTARHRISAAERVFLLLCIPALVLLSMAPWAMLAILVTLFPLGLAIHWILRMARERRRSQDGTAGSFHVPDRPRGAGGRIRHHWTVNAADPRDRSR